MVGLQLRDAGGRALERPPVRGQHQGGVRQLRHLVQRVKEPLQRVAIGLHRVHADVGGNGGQQHVAADQQLILCIVQSHVFGRVAKAADALPNALTDAHARAVHQAHIGVGDFGHHAGVITDTGFYLCQFVRLAPAMCFEKSHCGCAAKIGQPAASEQRRLVFAGAHPQGRLPALAQPVGQAHVVGVHVRDQHAQDGQALQCLRFDLLPSLSGGGVVDAAVHRRPALLHHVGLGGVGQAVAQQPKVDVVEGEGQTHAQPEHAWRHFGDRAGRRQVLTQRVDQRQHGRARLGGGLGFGQIGHAWGGLG